MGNYTVKNRKPSKLTKAIANGVESLQDIGEHIPCQGCNGQMWRVDNGDYPHYEPVDDGRILRVTERYYCDDCNTWAEFTQIFRADCILVSVSQDVWDS